VSEIDSLEQGFWYGKRVLVTGHTGFKGGWLCYWLHLLGAHVTGYAQVPATAPHLFGLLGLAEMVDSNYGDIVDSQALRHVMAESRPEVVFHLAAQAQVVPSYVQPLDTFSTNVMGTVAVLEALRHCVSARVCVVVTSDKCYAQPGTGLPFSESDPLGGSDPYSASKAAAELAVAAYRRSYFGGVAACSIATVRAGNALGGGDWSGHRLMPNSIRALVAGEPIRLTQPHAVRPWQYVLEPLSGYLSLAEHQYADPRAYAESWNFGPEGKKPVSVRELAQLIIAEWGGGSIVLSDPVRGHCEEPNLCISISKVQQRLEWQPAFDLAHTVRATVHSYRALYGAMAGSCSVTQQVRTQCASDIAAYTRTARAKGIAWAVRNTLNITGVAD